MHGTRSFRIPWPLRRSNAKWDTNLGQTTFVSAGMTSYRYTTLSTKRIIWACDSLWRFRWKKLLVKTGYHVSRKTSYLLFPSHCVHIAFSPMFGWIFKSTASHIPITCPEHHLCKGSSGNDLVFHLRGMLLDGQILHQKFISRSLPAAHASFFFTLFSRFEGNATQVLHTFIGPIELWQPA